MIGQLLLALNLMYAQDAPLEIANPRPTLGYRGPLFASADKGRIPGDVGHFTFDLKGVQLDKAGRASFSLLYELRDDKGKLAFREGPVNSVGQCFFGGDVVPVSARMEIPFDLAPGAYSLKVQVEDRLSKKKVTFERTGKVLAPDFGIVRVALFSDREGQVPAAPVGVKGHDVYVHFALVGFGRDKTTQHPKVAVKLRILDESNKEVTTLKGDVDADAHVPTSSRLVPLHFDLTLNRAGTYRMELQATDQITGKTSEVSFPYRIVEP